MKKHHISRDPAVKAICFANCDRLATVRVLPETSPEIFQATLIFQD